MSVRPGSRGSRRSNRENGDKAGQGTEPGATAAPDAVAVVVAARDKLKGYVVGRVRTLFRSQLQRLGSMELRAYDHPWVPALGVQLRLPKKSKDRVQIEFRVLSRLTDGEAVDGTWPLGALIQLQGSAKLQGIAALRLRIPSEEPKLLERIRKLGSGRKEGEDMVLDKLPEDVMNFVLEAVKAYYEASSGLLRLPVTAANAQDLAVGASFDMEVSGSAVLRTFVGLGSKLGVDAVHWKSRAGPLLRGKMNGLLRQRIRGVGPGIVRLEIKMSANVSKAFVIEAMTGLGLAKPEIGKSWLANATESELNRIFKAANKFFSARAALDVGSSDGWVDVDWFEFNLTSGPDACAAFEQAVAFSYDVAEALAVSDAPTGVTQGSIDTISSGTDLSVLAKVLGEVLLQVRFAQARSVSVVSPDGKTTHQGQLEGLSISATSTFRNIVAGSLNITARLLRVASIGGSVQGRSLRFDISLVDKVTSASELESRASLLAALGADWSEDDAAALKAAVEDLDANERYFENIVALRKDNMELAAEVYITHLDCIERATPLEVINAVLTAYRLIRAQSRPEQVIPYHEKNKAAALQDELTALEAADAERLATAMLGYWGARRHSLKHTLACKGSPLQAAIEASGRTDFPEVFTRFEPMLELAGRFAELRLSKDVEAQAKRYVKTMPGQEAKSFIWIATLGILAGAAAVSVARFHIQVSDLEGRIADISVRPEELPRLEKLWRDAVRANT